MKFWTRHNRYHRVLLLGWTAKLIVEFTWYTLTQVLLGSTIGLMVQTQVSPPALHIGVPWFEVQLWLLFPACTHQEAAVMTQVLGSLPCTWESRTEFQLLASVTA